MIKEGENELEHMSSLRSRRKDIPKIKTGKNS